MPVWAVAREFVKQATQAIKAAGGGKSGFDKVRKQNPGWFTKSGPRKTTKLDPRTGKPVPGQKASKAAPASNKSGAWGKLPESVRKKLLAGNTKGMSQEQLAKYRTLYKNRNA